MKKYKHIQQKDMQDCGAACLATICKQHGLKYPISKIREIAGTDKMGTNAYGLIKAAEELGFTAKGVKATKDVFFEPFPLPAIAHVIVDKSFSITWLFIGLPKRKLSLPILQKAL